jgi:hypothetical protein
LEEMPVNGNFDIRNLIAQAKTSVRADYHPKSFKNESLRF